MTPTTDVEVDSGGGQGPAPGVPIVELSAITKRYGGVLAVDGADLRIGRGEVLGLVGKNGAGKSTVIKILAGLVPRDSGEIRIDGTPVDISSPTDSQDLGLAFVHQDLSDVATMTVSDNLWLGRDLPRRLRLLVDRRRVVQSAAEMLAAVGAEVDPRSPISMLSVAERQLVMLARAVARDARVVVMDEPTSALSAREVAKLAAVIRSLSEGGTSVVFVSHRLDEVREFCDRVTVMRDARVVADRPTTDLTHRELVAMITGHDDLAEITAREHSHATDDEILTVSGLSRGVAVRDVSFRLHRGEVLGIGGLVGSGRTELVRLLVGADKASSGEICLRGEPVRFRNPADAADRGVIMLPEDRRADGFVANLSIRENLTIAALDQHRLVRWLTLTSRNRERHTARGIVDRLGIVMSDVEQPVQRLSGGNQQKVVLGKWLVHGADVLVFDEPTQGVDVEAKEEIFREIDELAADGKGIIVISSELSELVRACDRVVVLQEGRARAELAGDAVTEAAILEACYASA